MKGFEKVPDELATEQGLTLQARAVYPILLYLAWKAGARAGERVELPPLEKIAEAAGCGVTALKGYVAELRRAGWIETRRAARGRPQTYVIHDAPRGSESGSREEPRGSESGSRVGRNPAHSRARVPSRPDIGPDGDYVPSEEELLEPPAIVKDEAGQNLPLNRLLDECGIDRSSPRVGQAVAALNGRKGEPGIRHLFWEECRRYADETDGHAMLALMHEEPEKFAFLLEQAIQRKADKYRRALGGALLTPTALLRWWLDMEKQKSGAALSPEEIARIR